MLIDTLVPCDGVTLARSVRAIAAQARRTLKRPSDRGEARDLLAAISNLERDSLTRSSGDLSRWLASLRRRIELHGSSSL